MTFTCILRTKLIKLSPISAVSATIHPEECGEATKVISFLSKALASAYEAVFKPQMWVSDESACLTSYR